jgi:hypothetical protein
MIRSGIGSAPVPYGSCALRQRASANTVVFSKSLMTAKPPAMSPYSVQ